MLAVLPSVYIAHELVPISSFYAPLSFAYDAPLFEYVHSVYHVYDAFLYVHAVSFPIALMLLFYVHLDHHTTDYLDSSVFFFA
jgi:hypothetical protein